MQSPRCCTLLVVAALVVGCWTGAALARPPAAADSGEQEEDSAADLTPPAVVTIPIRLLNDYDSMFNRELNKRLFSMSDSDLSVLEAGLNAPAGDDGDNVAPQDGEMMLGDEPSSSDDDGPREQPLGFAVTEHAVTEQPDDLTQTLMIRESFDSEEIPIEIKYKSTPNKKLRLKNIQNQIMQYMGWPAQTSSPSPIIKKRQNATAPVVSTDQQRDAITLLYESVHDLPAYPSEAFTEKTQSFYPICQVPKHTNEDIWNNKESMNLMFNVSFPKAAHGNLVKVNTAKLRLYKQLVSCNSQTSNETDDFLYCQPTWEENVKRSSNNMSIAVPVILEDKQIRVSIYAYTRSLKRKRVKRKMLDSRMMPYYSEKWTEWNIRGAVRSWRRDSSRNYGISIEVEDDEGNLLPVVRFFKPLNCSGDASTTTPKPIPGFLMEAMQQHGGYGMKNGEGNANINVSSLRTMQAFNFNLVHRYPMIDVTTVEVPESEAQTALMYQYAKLAFQENLAGKASQSPASRSGDEPQNDHRIRHNTRPMDPTKMSKEEREFRDRIIVKGIIHRNTNVSQPTSFQDHASGFSLRLSPNEPVPST